MQHLPVKTHFLLQVGIQVANQEIEKLGREAQRLHLLVKTQCFVQLGISCELRNRKNMGWEADRRHLLVNRQCFAQFGIRSAACKVMFPQQSLETKRCENIRERDSRWTKYSIPATRTMLNPRTPKSQCFSVRFSKSDVKGWIFFAHWGYLTSGYINIELWG